MSPKQRTLGSVDAMAATRQPGVLSRRGWPQNPRRARGSAVGRPGSRDRQSGARCRRRRPPRTGSPPCTAERRARPHERLLARSRAVSRPPGPGQRRGPPSRATTPRRSSTPLGGPLCDSARTHGRPRRPSRRARRSCSSRATKSAPGRPARCCNPSRHARGEQNALVESLQGLHSLTLVVHAEQISYYGPAADPRRGNALSHLLALLRRLVRRDHEC